MRAIPTIDGHETQVLLHNDAVVQGLCEAPFMRENPALGRHDDWNGTR